MSTPNRELSQFGSFVSVNDTNKKISIGSTFAQITSDNLLVTGISTLGTISAENSFFTGIVTANQFYGNLVGTATTYLVQVTTADYTTNAGLATTATNVKGGIASVTTLYVSGISTLGSVEISSGIVSSTSGLVTYYGDGGKLSNVVTQIVAGAGISVTGSTGIVTVTATGTGSTADNYWVKTDVGIHTLSNVGIGTTNPTSKLQVQGTVSISSTTTSAEFIGGGSDLRNLSGTHLVSYASASDISNSSLSISGISTYNQVGILTGSFATETGDSFGVYVTTSADGKTIVVGAYLDEVGATTGTGVVYVFDRVGNSFNQVGILTSILLTNGELFGISISTSADGKTIVVGAPYDEVGATSDTGVVYVFDRVGNSFNQVGILTGSLDTNTPDFFGYSVDTSSDGKTIVVGAIYDEVGITTSTGITYVFDRVGNSFNQVGILTGTYATDIDDNFGGSVAISADGKTIVIGNPSDEIGVTTGTGVVYVFDRVGNSFNQVGILTGSLSTTINDSFGKSVSTSSDGKTIVVGAYNDEVGATSDTGVVYVFDRVGNSFNQVGILTGSFSTNSLDYFGTSVATSADGKTIVVGAYNDEIGATTGTGVAYIFKRVGNSFNQVGILTGSYATNAGDYFGISVDVSADGKTIVVGAYQDEIGATLTTGVAYVFDEIKDTYLYSTPSGNIGIGTTNPTSKLTVAGAVSATSFVGDGSALTGIVTQIVAGAGISVTGSTGIVTITATGTGSGTSIGVYDETSFIGYPTAINFGPNLSVSSISSGIVTVTATGTGSTADNYWVKTDVGIHTLSNVGIGTTNPTSKLTVAGTVSATSFVGDGSGLTGLVGIGTGVYIQENQNPLGAATTINFGNGLSASLSSGIVTVSATGTGTSIGVYDETSFIGYPTAINFGPNLSVSSISSGIVTVSATGTGSTSDNYWVKTDVGIHTLSNVGIGTTNPTSKLTVAGTVSATTFSGSGSALTGIVTQIVAGAGISVTGSTGIVTITATGTGSGTSIGVYDETSFIGYPTAINFGSNLTVSSISSGIVTVSATGTGSTSFILFDDPNTYYTCNTTVASNIGANNIFFGASSGSSNTSGSNNTFVGECAGYSNSTGANNIFFGLSSGQFNNSGCHNFFFGYQSGYNSISSTDNIYIGRSSGYAGGSFEGNNIFLGAYSGRCNASHSNVFLGRDSGRFNTSGCYNTFFGTFSGRCNTTGFNNTFLGAKAGRCNNLGSLNIFIGADAASTTTNTASSRIIIGSGTSLGEFNSPDTTKSCQFAIGTRTNSSPSNYWLVGNENFNIGIGTTNPTEKLYVGGNGCFTGCVRANSFVLSDGTPISGGSADFPIKVYNGHTFYTCNTTIPVGGVGSNNIFFGCLSGSSAASTASGTLAMGVCAGYQVSGYYNNFFGYGSGRFNTNGSNNSFFGALSGIQNTSGSNNVFLGYGSGQCNTTGNCNIYIGSNNSTSSSSGASNRVIIGSGVDSTNSFDAPSTANTQLAIGARPNTNPSNYWIVGDSSYNVGINTTTLTCSKLNVGGGGFFNGGITASGVVTATSFCSNTIAAAPISVASSIKVTNLNADFLDGLSAISTNTPSSIVSRDASGNFSAGTITANLTGTASTASKTVNSITFSNGGDGASSGTTFDGSTSRTISYNSIGAGGLSTSNTWSAQQTITNASLIVTNNSSSNAVRITQTGTGNALVVEDDTNPDATPFVINNIGQVGIGTAVDSLYGLNVSGAIKASSYIQGTYFSGSNSSQPAGQFNRTTTTGNIININYNTVTQGNISIASDGITVQYLSFLGSHWSMLPSGEIENILPGTIMETIDELVDWKLVSFEKDGVILKQCYNGGLSIGSTITITYEEQQYVGTIEKEEPELNMEKAVRVKVSDLEGSSAVYGVFLDWNNDNDEPHIGKWNNLNVASVGNYFIRINANEQVNIGDLIESAGNGCGKVQNDDIIRSKTVGKVTSTIKQKIYDDGSYLVTAVIYCG